MGFCNVFPEVPTRILPPMRIPPGSHLWSCNLFSKDPTRIQAWNWSSCQRAKNTPPLSVTGSVIAPSALIISIHSRTILASFSHHYRIILALDSFRSDQVRLNWIRLDQIRLDQIRLHQIRSDSNGLDSIKSDQIKLDQIRFDQIRLDYIRLDWMRLDQITVDQIRLEQIRMDFCSHQIKLDSMRSDQS